MGYGNYGGGGYGGGGFGGGFNPNQLQAMLQQLMQVPTRSPNTFLRKTVELTQGSSDAFIEGNIKTNVNKSEGRAFVIKGVLCYWPAFAANIPDESMHFQLTAKSVAAQLDPDDKDLIRHVGKRLELLTTGVAITDYPEEHWFDEIVFGETLYINFDSTATGAANTVWMTIMYEEAMITDFIKIQRAFQ